MTDYKKDFPLLAANDIAYLDNAATTQRPIWVLDAEREFYEKHNANPLRGFYDLATLATEEYERARESVREFINAGETAEIIFTRNTTESINLVAYSYGLNNLCAEDEILVTIEEHHSNLLPWQMVSKKTGAKLKFIECDEKGEISKQDILTAVNKHTKLAAMTHISNVIGRKNPVEELIGQVHKNGGVVLIDAAQSAPHMRLDVRELDADFLAFSGHKLFAPMGIGVLYGKKEILADMPPFLTGGEMIDSVSRQSAVYAPLPHKFEAGTVNAGGAAGLRAAIEYINDIGFEKIEERERKLSVLAFSEMKKTPYIHIIGSDDPQEHSGIISFTIDGVHPHDISEILNEDGVAIRAGHHCAEPLLAHLGVMQTARASIVFYNTEDDIMRFTRSLGKIRRLMGYGE